MYSEKQETGVSFLIVVKILDKNNDLIDTVIDIKYVITILKNKF